MGQWGSVRCFTRGDPDVGHIKVCPHVLTKLFWRGGIEPIDDDDIIDTIVLLEVHGNADEAARLMESVERIYAGRPYREWAGRALYQGGLWPPIRTGWDSR